MSDSSEIILASAAIAKKQDEAADIFINKVIAHTKRELFPSLEDHIHRWFRRRFWILCSVAAFVNIVAAAGGYWLLKGAGKEIVQEHLKSEMAETNASLKIYSDLAKSTAGETRDFSAKAQANAATTEMLTKQFETMLIQSKSLNTEMTTLFKETEASNKKRADEIESLNEKLNAARIEYANLLKEIGTPDDELKTLIVKQEKIGSGSKDGRDVTFVKLSLGTKGLSPEEHKKVIGRISRVVYRLDPLYFTKSSIVADNAKDDFSITVTIWGSTKFNVDVISKILGKSNNIEDKFRISWE